MLPEPISVSFANTRSSSEHDLISTRTQWLAWVRSSPGLSPLGQALDGSGLAVVRYLRDDVQALLHAAANRDGVEEAVSARVTCLARSCPPYELSWTGAGPVVVPGSCDPAAVLSHHLARAALDLLLGVEASALRACAGNGCRKVFVAGRPDRRWCDSKICGNRARVSLHSARNH